MKNIFSKIIYQKFLKALVIGAVFVFVCFAVRVSAAQATQFYVESGYQPRGQETIEASQKRVSNYAYFYIEDAWFNGLNSASQQQINQIIDQLAYEFDRIIYPKETTVFGSEWNPGIDNDPKITVLLTEMTPAPGGYFNPDDEFSKSEAERSNQREMVYLNTVYLTDPKINAFLAHEFQHLITFNQKNRLRQVDDEVWLNEARSEYAPTLCGYNNIFQGSNLARRVEYFLKQPTDSLTHWQNDSYDYGSVSLFIHYLVDHFGERILTQMMATEKTGAASINWALSSLGYLETFDEVFSRWVVTILVNDCNLGVGQEYCYLNPNLSFQNLHIDFPGEAGPAVSSATFNQLAQNWSGNWHRFSAVPRTIPRYLSIEFDGSSTSDFKVFYLVQDKEGRVHVGPFGLHDRKGFLYINNFGTQVNQVDLVIIQTSDNDSSAFLTLQPFTIRVATHDGIYGPLTDNTLALENTGRVYLVRDGQKQWIISAAIFESRYLWPAIKSVSDADLDYYQETEPINTFAEGSLVKTAGEARVYVISGARKHWISNAFIFVDLGYQWEQIKVVSENDLSHHSTGESLADSLAHPEGTLLKGFTANVYYLQNNKKRLVADPEAFERMNFLWFQIWQVTDTRLNQYQTGEPIV